MKILRLTLLIISMTGLTACGFFDNENNLGSTDEVFCTDANCETGLSSYEAVPVETFSVVNQNQVLKSMTSCTGLDTANVSAGSRSIYNGSKNSFSMEGKADSVGAPMWMAITSLAGNVCSDLVAQEEGQSAAERRIFKSIDFSQGPSSINALQVASVISNMARSCWGRDASSKERDLINSAFFGDPGDNNDDTFTGNNATETRRAATFLCAGVLASLSANQM